MMDNSLEGNLPIHFVGKDGYNAIFFDDDGEAVFLAETAEGIGEEIIKIDSGAPHHGVALAFGDHFLLTKPYLAEGSERAVPVGINAFEKGGDKLDIEFDPCNWLHGEAATKTTVAFGCTDGVLLISKTDEGLTSTKISAPQEDIDNNIRVGTVAAHDEVSYFLGNYGKNKYVEIDPVENTLTPKDIAIDYSRFAFSKDGKYIVFLGRDGSLGVVDTTSRELVHQSLVTSESTGENHGAADPKMELGKGMVYITNPAEGSIVVFDLTTLSIKTKFEVGGMPTMVTRLDYE